MVKHNQSPTQHQQFVKVRDQPPKGPAVDFGDESEIRISCNDNKKVNKQTTSQSSEMLSTGEFLSAVGHMWDCANQSLARFQPRKGPGYSDSVRRNSNEKCYLAENVNIIPLDLKDSRYLQFDFDLCRYSPCIVRQSLKCTRLTQIINYIPFEDHKVENFISNMFYDSCVNNHVWLKEYNRLNPNGWGSNSQREHLMSTSRESPKTIHSFKSEAASFYAVRRYQGMFLSPSGHQSNFQGIFSGGRYVDFVNRRTFISSLYLDCILQGVLNKHYTTSISMAFSLKMKLFANIPEHCCCYEVNDQQMKAVETIQCEKIQADETIQCAKSKIQAEFGNKSSLPVPNGPVLAKREHAFSGALAGIFVSLCLHPIDTVKTVAQTYQAGPKSPYYIGRSLVSERGLLGLYRGVSSKITTSAPISALYTFTYESVKGFLLPSLAKEYHCIAHCAAGGCASIATSFIFTPSEHIKQQMQVNSKYLSCWNAASRIIEKGGLLSLYTGWGAVLCRNIPHSIIKFYTYESLKQMLMSPEPPRQPNTLQTLLCGGIAGSAATLFSTPFDVVKTRLQTQMPGSARKYPNILNALQHIRKHEGVSGLYRGLVPRLVMYMSQGALFFASYEFFKSLISLELSQDNVTAA